jgi:hypothetical protein
MSSDLGMSLELLSDTSIEFFVQHVLIVAHVGVNMTLTRRRQMSNNLKKLEIIKALAVKQKVKHHFMKRGDNVSKGSKHHNDYLFHFL